MSDTADIRFEAQDLHELPPEEAVRHLLERAVRQGASDVFFLADELETSVSVRQWGLIQRVTSVPSDVGRRFIGAIKVHADMDIAEKRRPLEGRWILHLEDKTVDLRVNSLPTLYGEDVAIRVLDRTSGLLSLDDLGMSPVGVNSLKAMLSSPSGLILVTGPTGSGKTTTLYAMLQHLHTGERKINTLEDPIEYALTGIRQSQVHPRLGVDFAELLRNVIRQAPDVIMVGEVRDAETAITAVRAANSGHLVLATLHAPVAATAVESLLALNVHPHFLASSLLGVVAQRLVRTLNPKTRIPIDLSESPHTFEEVRDLLKPDEGKVLYGPGRGSGTEKEYDGRVGVFELMHFTNSLRRMVAEGRSSRELEQHAIGGGMIEFRRAALLKVAQGITSTEEVFRAVPTEYLGLDGE